jgi:hypothetical protein
LSGYNVCVLREFTLSLVLASAAAVVGYKHHLNFSLGLTLVWLVIALMGLIRYRWRGLWLLPGAPAALVWPYYMLIVELQPCGGDRWCG